jgi:hypothetical protein
MAARRRATHVLISLVLPKRMGEKAAAEARSVRKRRIDFILVYSIEYRVLWSIQCDSGYFGVIAQHSGNVGLPSSHCRPAS